MTFSWTPTVPHTFPVAVFAEHSDPSAGTVGRIEVADPVVGQADLIDLRVRVAQCRSQSTVDGADGALSFPGHHDPLGVDDRLDGGLGEDRAVSVLDEDAVRLEFEERLFPPAHVADEQIEGSIRGLEHVTLVFEVLDPVHDVLRVLGGEIPTAHLRLGQDRGPSRQLADDHPGVVPNGFGVDMLIGVSFASKGGRVQSRLVGEGGCTHVREVRIEGEVHDLGDVMRNRGEAAHSFRGDRGEPHLQGQVGDHRTQIGVPGPLPVPVDASLNLGHPRAYGDERVRHGGARVIVKVTSEDRVRDDFGDFPDHLLDLVGEETAVGVAQDQPLGSGLVGCLQRFESEPGVGPVPVEEVLGIEEDPPTVGAEMRDRIADHGDAFLQIDPERLGHVIVPRFADETDDFGSCLEQRRELLVVCGAPVGVSRRSEGDERGVLEVEFPRGPREELVVLGVGARPSSLDVGDTEIVQQAADLKFVASGERDPLLLRAVAQRRVVDLDSSDGHAVSRCNERPSAGRRVGSALANGGGCTR